MSLPVSKEQFTFVIWSNEYLDWDNYRDAFEEDYSSLTDDEKYQLMCDLNNDYLDDERRNLDIQVGTPIIVIADIGRWDGRHTGYREISSGCIKDCLESQLDGVTWYVDGKGDFLARATRYCEEVLPIMGEVRRYADLLETRVADDLWDLPSYQEILFGK